MDGFRVVDADGHVLEPADLWEKNLEAPFKNQAPRLVRDESGQENLVIEGRFQLEPGLGGLGAVGVNGRANQTRELWAQQGNYAEDSEPGGFDPHKRVKDMDTDGIEIAVLYPTIGLFFGAVEDRGLVAALCRVYNDWLADYCKPYPERLFGVALVPLQYPEDAVLEARRAVTELGFSGVMIRPNPYKSRQLHDEAYEPFWAAVEELGVPLTIHEGQGTIMPEAGRDRFDQMIYRQTIAHPHEQQMACLAIIGGGVMEHFSNLKVAFLESGAGWVPFWLQRFDEYWEQWPWELPHIKTRPTDYFLQQGYVSCEADEWTLPAVLDVLGDDKVVFASDYPHHDATFPGAPDPIRNHDVLSGVAKRKILRDNAFQLYGL